MKKQRRARRVAPTKKNVPNSFDDIDPRYLAGNYVPKSGVRKFGGLRGKVILGPNFDKPLFGEN